MARRWSSVRRVADVRCGMRVTPSPHMGVTHRCAAAEGSADEGGFFITHNEGGRLWIAPRVRDQTTIMRTPREHTTTQTSCGCQHRRNGRHIAGVPEIRLPPRRLTRRTPPPASAPSR